MQLAFIFDRTITGMPSFFLAIFLFSLSNLENVLAASTTRDKITENLIVELPPEQESTLIKSGENEGVPPPYYANLWALYSREGKNKQELANSIWTELKVSDYLSKRISESDSKTPSFRRFQSENRVTGSLEESSDYLSNRISESDSKTPSFRRKERENLATGSLEESSDYLSNRISDSDSETPSFRSFERENRVARSLTKSEPASAYIGSSSVVLKNPSNKTVIQGGKSYEGSRVSSRSSGTFRRKRDNGDSTQITLKSSKAGLETDGKSVSNGEPELKETLVKEEREGEQRPKKRRKKKSPTRGPKKTKKRSTAKPKKKGKKKPNRNPKNKKTKKTTGKPKRKPKKNKNKRKGKNLTTRPPLYVDVFPAY